MRRRSHVPSTGLFDESVAYWLTLPLHWSGQMFRNGSDILRVLDILRFRPLAAGLVNVDHPWVTGVSPHTGELIWRDNLIYRSPPAEHLANISDETVLLANGRFLAQRVRQSAIVPEVPIGPARRMPHCINYMHGSSHFNSGIILLNDLQDAYRHINDPAFRRELARFVKAERREVLFMLRDRDYDPREYAYLSCCMRTHFRWFCNPNGPQAHVLWGNSAPFPAANLITGYWSDDVYALKKSGGADAVARPPIGHGHYFQSGPYDQGREYAIWPEKLLAWGSYYRIRMRGRKGGMFFIDRRDVYADQIARRAQRGLPDEERARF
ncbi:hypothetical protein [Schlesneria paludicola]|uniref:hypothetical protein n=1 Tax=Schlesneria paludicola TaxID=360056 RepID=UPI0012F94622|nr:hypothetical protein [Schlesneria paludicola]